MKKKNNVMMVATIAITLLMIGCVIVMGIIRNSNRNSNRNNPDVKPPEQTTDTTDTTPDQTTPEIPSITDDGKGTDPAPKPGDVSIDVKLPVDGSRDDKPGIDDDVIIIPGVKGEGE